jgi:hypothetical protein
MKKLFLTLSVLLSAVSGLAGYWAANSSMMVNNVSSPVLCSAVVSPIAAGTGHVAGGTAAGLFQGQKFGEAFANSFDGIGKSMAIGGAIGVASTIGVSYANGINPWTGKEIVSIPKTNSLKPLGLGSTGRTVAKNLTEQLAMEEAMSNPTAGKVIIQDKRWSGWSKMQYIHTGLDGSKTVIHYAGKFENGVLTYVDDFKFK